MNIDPEVAQAFPKYQSHQARSILKSIAGKPLKNIETGDTAFINSTQKEKLFSEKAIAKTVYNGFTREDHFEALANIESLYSNAILLKEHPDLKNGDQAVKIKRFAAPFVIDGESGFVIADAFLTVKTSLDKNTERIYSLELDEIFQSDVRTDSGSQLDAPAHREYTPSDVHKLQQKHKKIKSFWDKLQKNHRFSIAGENKKTVSNGWYRN